MYSYIHTDTTLKTFRKHGMITTVVTQLTINNKNIVLILYGEYGVGGGSIRVRSSSSPMGLYLFVHRTYHT